MPNKLECGTLMILRSGVITCLLMAYTGACADTEPSFAPVNPHTLLAKIHLSARAVNLSTAPPYDTVRLQTVTLLGDSTPAPVSVHYRSSDTTRFTIDSSGFVRAVRPTSSPVSIVASASYHGVTRVDTALVTVADGTPRFVRRITLRPRPGETADIRYKWPVLQSSIFAYQKFVLAAYDVADVEMSGIVIDVASANTDIAGPSSLYSNIVEVSGRRDGTVWFYARAFAYGTYFTDSLLVTAGRPLLYWVSAKPKVVRVNGMLDTIMEFVPGQIHIPPNSDVIWSSPWPSYTGADTLGPIAHVFFDDSTAPEPSRVPSWGPYCFSQHADCDNDHGGGGNFVIQANNQYLGNEARRFNRPGRYPYHNTEGGSGVIIVDE